MFVKEETLESLARVPDLTLIQDVPLSRYTRFGIGGPAAVFLETPLESSFMAALRVAKSSGDPFVVIGGGTNLIVSDSGYDGIVLRFTAASIQARGTEVCADAGGPLQAVVDCTVDAG